MKLLIIAAMFATTGWALASEPELYAVEGSAALRSRSKDRLIALGKVMDELCYNG